ncbi:hypothetical protein TCAL_06376 [Tigriopus californicus]|uniref:Cathepsin L n=1 Tax=Tigriopus californicus TaxID=6832 RepID=A0A553PH46_TIGCA|nr:procathepsin L-like [Tigriopus californicus]TRY77009.1 hypothetical protein TCAL_06376 [Tigriopus californicus]|eukprot:TCALIF_06376-PA protein Name:"Similar to Cp1 Cathepsin L (Drosophila melanogaster)" AED:0.10 eAED:0.10 QI:0/0/0/1/1/1/4/0/332
MKVLFTLTLLVGLFGALSSLRIVVEEWEAWKCTHAQNYSSPTEEKFRMKVFMENKAKVTQHNHRAHLGQHSYFLKINKYGDLLHDEFIKLMNGYRMDLRKKSSVGATFISPANVDLPTEVDWRTMGTVTPVKDQGQCGSCWAFSATGSLEGQHFRQKGNLVGLSEQNLIDCSELEGNHGCDGGLMDLAFKYIKKNDGIDTEMAYPYEGVTNTCRYYARGKGATDIGYVDIPQGDERKLMEAVATVGPVSVAINAAMESFQFYSHGVYDEPSCNPYALDHGVLAIGYGSEGESHFWLVKNSWGTTWGDAGFIKMSRNKDNQCGIATDASFPLV